MSEYINRNELLKNINEKVAEAHNERCSQLLEAILNAPTADVEEVRHGHWIERIEKPDRLEDDVEVFYDCSECGTSHWSIMPPYCPECGAKMDCKPKKSYYDAKLSNDCENCQRCHLICEEDNVCYKEEDNEKNTI